MVKRVHKSKNHKRSKTVNKNTRKRNIKSKSNSSHSRSRNMRGGDDGRYVLAPSYFGKGTSGYYADGASELKTHGNQFSVSQGTISSNGQMAGPNTYPMVGGECGCKRQKQNIKKSKNHQRGGFTHHTTTTHQSRTPSHPSHPSHTSKK